MELCRKSDREGWYLMSTTEVDGDCGPLGPGIVQLQGAAPPEEDSPCQLASADEWSEDDCVLTRVVQCADGARLTIMTRQQDYRGRVFTGIAMLQRPNPCRSAYKLHFLRQ